MAARQQSATSLIAIGLGVGFTAGALGLIAIVQWPHVILTEANGRALIVLVVILGFVYRLDRRRTRQNEELRRLIRWGSSVDEAERILRNERDG